MSAKIPLNLPALRAAYPSLALFVDVSKWQGDIDWAELAKYIDGAIIKTTGCLKNGVLHIDGKAQKNTFGCWTNGTNAGSFGVGRTVGHYHYAKQVLEDGSRAPSAETQALYFVNQTKKIYAALGFSFTPAFMCLDLEPGELRDARDAGFSPLEIEGWVRDFMDTLQSLAPSGCRCEIYYSDACVGAADGGLDFLRDDPRFEGWLAGYPTGGPSAKNFPSKPLGLPDGWPWGAWQFSSDGSSPGVKGDLDLNVCRPGSIFERIMKGGKPPASAPSAVLPLVGLVAAVGGLALYRRPSLWRHLKARLRRLF